MRVLYFGELDPFSGTFPQDRKHLPRLVRTLKLLCLAYDAVVLPPGSLVEHGLALPALENLAPLVRAGRLGTSADKNAPGPPEYFEARIRRHFEGTHPSPRVQAWRRGECDALVERWLRILPTDWSVRRDVAGQVASTQELVLGELAVAPETPFSEAASALRRRVRDALDKGHHVDRDRLLMLVASIRGSLSVGDMAYVTTLVQGAYFHAGPRLHDVGNEPGAVCEIYPGGFRQSLERQAQRGARLTIQHPFAEDVLGPAFGARATRAGIDLAALGAMPPGDIAELVGTDEWRSLAVFLRSAGPASVRDELAGVLRGRDVRDRLHLVPTEALRARQGASDFDVAPTVCIPPWGAGARAALAAGAGPSVPGHDHPKDRSECGSGVVFDWASRSLGFQGDGEGIEGRTVRLTPSHAHLLTLLAVSGEVGASIDEAQRALIEMDADAAGPTPQLPRLDESLSPSTEPSRIVQLRRRDRMVAAERALRNRLDVARHHLSKILAEFGLGIATFKGRMRLDSPGVSIINTPWAPSARNAPPAPRLAGLLSDVWRVLHNGFPNEVDAETIAAALGRPGSESHSQYVSKIVHRLDRALRESDSPWRVHRDFCGHYRLAVLPPVEQR